MRERGVGSPVRGCGAIVLKVMRGQALVDRPAMCAVNSVRQGAGGTGCDGMESGLDIVVNVLVIKTRDRRRSDTWARNEATIVRVIENRALLWCSDIERFIYFDVTFLYTEKHTKKPKANANDF